MVEVTKVKKRIVLDDDGPVSFAPDRPTTSIGAPIDPDPVIVRRLHPHRFKQAEQERSIWLCYPPQGTPFDALLDPTYWSHCAKLVKPGSRIEVYAEDGSYWAEFLVRSATTRTLQIFLMRHHELGEIRRESASSFSVEYRGPIHKHAVVRRSDNQVVHGGFDSEAGAMTWLGLNSRGLGV